MRWFRTAAFERRYRSLDPSRQSRVDHAVRQLAALLATGRLPAGLGLKTLRPGLWEIRAGLGDRAIFRRAGDLIELLIVGTHDEIRRFLRRR